MDCRVLWVCLAQLDLLESLGRMEIRCISQQQNAEAVIIPLIIPLFRRDPELSWNDVLVCRVRLESTVRKEPREEREST